MPEHGRLVIIRVSGPDRQHGIPDLGKQLFLDAVEGDVLPLSGVAIREFLAEFPVKAAFGSAFSSWGEILLLYIIRIRTLGTEQDQTVFRLA